MKSRANAPSSPSSHVTEQQVLRKYHKFVRDSDSDEQSGSPDRSREKDKTNNHTNEKGDSYQRYGHQMSKKYYSKLFKEYALVDLSRYELGQIGCRWRTHKEVFAQKGQKICAALDCNSPSTDTFEMNFGYIQDGVKKNALVKVSLCNECEHKLNYKRSHRKVSNNKKEKAEGQEKQS